MTPSQRSRKWQKAHPEKVATWRAANVEKVRKSQRDAAKRHKAKDPAAWRKYHREYYQNVQRFRKYGITKADFDRMLTEQAGCCKICRRSLARPCIDHDHQTGVVRGILCMRCNASLGFVEGNLRAVQDYLGCTLKDCV